MIKVKDFVGVSNSTFSDAIKVALKEATETVEKIESVEVVPPWIVQMTNPPDAEFRITVRIFYSENGLE